MPIKNPERFSHIELEKKTIPEERLHRKQKLAGAFRIFGKLGLCEGITGHITARDPEFTDCFWVNPFGISFNQIKVSDLILCDSKGEIIEGKHSKLNRAAFAIHSSIHKSRPDVVSAAHAHSLYGSTWSTLGRLLDPITQTACAFYEDHAVFDDYSGVVFALSEGERIASVLGDKKAVILKNHGLLTVGETVEAAVWWFISMERCCQMQILAESTGHPLHLIQPEVALRTRDNAVGFPLVGWFNFEPLWQDIITEFPELME
ncbi:class II aldolase/adducin family protein [Legionella micdadei]|uniref:L-fuculose-phosphate aldolase n=1 Tax=Legionella micdadei TaxID=451 RepID=A0A098GC56_LEGMI|nr:class II aldolase/adducin family protein [Legionella micdadei]ARG96346.1 class II aldolase/adducin family protein [Legionella micdadei]ARG99097.1 class II aldolase/adducin family protein [Legionella micdadei]KTD29571.1 Decarboxylase NovR [Legionella micdadei]NSL18032.1 class II aldolase/adducin family protein [Legionella micdadei]CEG59547.1 L-fuculose-phosphate aldolase [Legionella micdadei]